MMRRSVWSMWFMAMGVLAASASNRIDEIAAWLPERPAADGAPASDRAKWDALAATKEGGKMIAAAATLLDKRVPEVTDEGYLEFSRNGNRTRFRAERERLTGGFERLYQAECLEGKGRFTGKIVDYGNAICGMKSWTAPAHDQSLSCFKGDPHVDLGSAALSLNLAYCLAWLGDALPDGFRKKVYGEIDRRTFRPYLAHARGERKLDSHWWFHGGNNWNSVCNGCVVRTALAIIPDRRLRAEFVMHAEGSVPYALAGYTSDGYCSEGMGYWNYGYGHHLAMGLSLRAATGGKIDLFADPKTKTIMEYAYGFQLQIGLSPHFADGGGNPSPVLLALGRQVWPDLVSAEAIKAPLLSGRVFQFSLRAFGQEPPPCEPKMGALPLRTWFPEAQVLISRGDWPQGRKLFGIAVKGGHNAELHNHNDVGSYAIMLDGTEMCGDPGGEVYTRRTFSKDRYVSKVLNSYGHPVPVVAGKLQRKGRAAAAKVLKADFTDDCDTLVLDCTAAYDVPALKSLVRTVAFDRKSGVIAVSDTVSFSEPSAFEVPIITYRNYEHDGSARHFEFSKPKKNLARTMTLDVSASADFAFRDEKIENPGKRDVARLAFAFREPVRDATITMRFSTGSRPKAARKVRSHRIPLFDGLGMREIGRLAVRADAQERVLPVPEGFVLFRTDDPNPDAAYATVVEPLRKKVKAQSGAHDVMREADAQPRVPSENDLVGSKYSLRVAIGDAVRAIRSQPCDGRAVAPRPPILFVRSLLDEEALPSGVVTNGAFMTVSSANPNDGSKRVLTCAKFMRYNCPLRFYWYSDRAPTDAMRFDRISFRVPGRIERPVWVDMISGRVFEIPAANVSFDGKMTTLEKIPMWDSPVLIVAASCVPRHVEWEKLSPREIVDYWYKPGQFENHMKALPPAGSAPWMEMKTEDFLPCIDKYGQFIHRDWPGKTRSDADMKRSAEAEAKDLAAHPGPTDWNRYGGWAAGPQLRATGRFRTEKVDGKWWLVDPEGRLYWSFGPVRVTPSSGMTPMNGDPCKPQRGNALPLPDRDCLFAELPPPPDAASATTFSQFWTTHDDLLLPFYRARGQTRVFDFSSANLYRKYGADYRRIFADLAHRRLRSWGANTIANSSDLDICLMDRTPYAERVECESRPIAGSYGMWKKFRDPWDDSFAKGVTKALETHGREAHDPWCIGFFVDNEINWGFTPRQLADWTMQSPSDQPAKKAAVAFLRAKYGDVGKLNAAWKASYSDWDDLLHSVLLPGPGAASDLAAFTRVIAEEYFKRVRAAVKAFDPHLLYLGCRFVGSKAKPWVIGPCAKHCDVVSYNIYLDTVGDWRLPDGLDAPVMVGEFHFGATDRGPFGTGVCVASNQTDRAEKLKTYVRSALANPQIVGAHWHQFADQATTGRFDGEYLQVGWTDICDTPYPETIQAVRAIGYTIYETRSKNVVTCR